MKEQIEISWKLALIAEFEKPYFAKLNAQVQNAYLTDTVFPRQDKIFAAFSHCPLPSIKVVILGQDPYHGPNQANGLAFSVPEEVAIPPSLQNIYKEISADMSTLPPRSGDLTRLAAQGVLLLNSSLSVGAGLAGSHHSFEWEQFTDVVVTTISQERQHVVFLLWGRFAIAKRSLIDEAKHLVLTAPHPSPLSAYRGFFGCKHFSQTNNYLVSHQERPIIW